MSKSGSMIFKKRNIKSNIVAWFRSLGAFSVGMFVGTCYGAVVATLTTYTLLRITAGVP